MDERGTIGHDASGRLDGKETSVEILIALRSHLGALYDRFQFPASTVDGLTRSEVLDAAGGAALERIATRFGGTLRVAQALRVLALREFLKVLAGKLFEPQVTRAIRALDAETRDRMAARVFEMVGPSGTGLTQDALARAFDPSLWRISDIPASDDNECYLRLSLFVSGMLVQEESIRQSGLTIDGLAERLLGRTY